MKFKTSRNKSRKSEGNPEDAGAEFQVDIVEGVVCRGFCDYFKGSGGEAECGGFSAVIRAMVTGTITAAQMEKVRGQTPPFPVRSGLLTEKLCSECSYFEDACDFQSADPPEGATPCGGYRFLQALLENGEISEAEL